MAFIARQLHGVQGVETEELNGVQGLDDEQGLGHIEGLGDVQNMEDPMEDAGKKAEDEDEEEDEMVEHSQLLNMGLRGERAKRFSNFPLIRMFFGLIDSIKVLVSHHGLVVLTDNIVSLTRHFNPAAPRIGELRPNIQFTRPLAKKHSPQERRNTRWMLQIVAVEHVRTYAPAEVEKALLDILAYAKEEYRPPSLACAHRGEYRAACLARVAGHSYASRHVSWSSTLLSGSSCSSGIGEGVETIRDSRRILLNGVRGRVLFSVKVT
jgi:hypothetical protein